MKVLQQFTEVDADGEWQVKKFEGGIGERLLISPSQKYLDNAAIMQNATIADNAKIAQIQSVSEEIRKMAIEKMKKEGKLPSDYKE